MKARLTLKIRPSASTTKFIGRYEGSSASDIWRLQVAAPPVDGKANEAIIRFLARLVRIAPSDVRIVSGATGSTKIVELQGVDPAHLRRAILESHGPRPHTGSAAPPED